MDKHYNYHEGKRDGIKLFAWWKDDIQYVGTTGNTLDKALKMVDDEEQEAIQERLSTEYIGHKEGS